MRLFVARSPNLMVTACVEAVVSALHDIFSLEGSTIYRHRTRLQHWTPSYLHARETRLLIPRVVYLHHKRSEKCRRSGPRSKIYHSRWITSVDVSEGFTSQFIFWQCSYIVCCVICTYVCVYVCLCACIYPTTIT